MNTGTKARRHVGAKGDCEEMIRSGKLCDNMGFAERVWAITAKIPQGKVATYGQIATVLKTRGCRAVGFSLGKNPYAPGVPCHRVVGSDGRLTGYAGGLPKKIQLLEGEGVPVVNGKVDLKRHLCPLSDLRP